MRTTYYTEQHPRENAWVVIEERWDGTVRVYETWDTEETASGRADQLNQRVRERAEGAWVRACDIVDQRMMDTEFPCRHGHQDCATEQGGACLDEETDKEYSRQTEENC